MLKNVRSSYILKIFFNHIEEIHKMKLVKYNKSLQNKLNVTLFNYKELSRRFIEYEDKRKGKEYNVYNDKLLYEGEFLNGIRNGKGKEYDENKHLIFEGQYLKGRRWNGKGYDYNNNLAYEIKNGKGVVKEYYKNKTLKFIGEYLNGEKNGKAKEYDSLNILIFDGEYLNGERNGEVNEYYIYNSKLKFKGEYKNGKILNGIIFDTMGNKICEIKEGNGFIKEYYYLDKIKYEGEFLDG